MEPAYLHIYEPFRYNITEMFYKSFLDEYSIEIIDMVLESGDEGKGPKATITTPESEFL